jgi:hypothetical protein
MPPINSRNTDKLEGYVYEHTNKSEGMVPPVTTPPGALHVSSTSSNLMSITSGNSVPMRGILPIEFMSDSDSSRFFPYTAYFDRIPKYTFFTQLNTSG